MHGYWFLADEFNLAPPELISALGPILDDRCAKVSVPGYGEISVHPQFRFFATQNPSRDAGRTRLPPSIRSLFRESNVGEFSPDELAQVLRRREYAGIQIGLSELGAQ